MAIDLISEGKSIIGIGAKEGVAKTGVSGGTIMFIIVLILIFITLALLLTLWLLKRKQFKYKIIIFERIDGRFQVSRRDKARRLPIGKSGDEVMYLRKFKKFLPTPTIQTGINTYWFFISDDGEWINFGTGDFDENRREMGAKFLDKEMRYARVGLDTMIKERHDKPSFWEKYGGLIAYTVLILVTAIGFWLLMDKMLDVSASAGGAVDSARGVLEQIDKILAKVNNVCTGGAGYTEVPVG